MKSIRLLLLILTGFVVINFTFDASYVSGQGACCGISGSCTGTSCNCPPETLCQDSFCNPGYSCQWVATCPGTCCYECELNAGPSPTPPPPGSTPTPGGGSCETGGWIYGNCGAGTCSPDQRRRKRYNTCTGWEYQCQVNPTPPCAPPDPITCANFRGATVTPSSVAPGGAVTVGCDFADSTLDCIAPATGAGYPFSSCNFSIWNGTVAQFNCIATSTPGLYDNYCNLLNVLNPKCANSSCIDGAVTVNRPPSGTVNGPVSVCRGDTSTYTGTCTDLDNNIDFTRLHWSPTNTRDWSQSPNPICQGGSSCSGPKQWNNTGSFYVAVNCYDRLGEWCSGNPFCNEWDPVTTTGTEVDCRSLPYPPVDCFNHPTNVDVITVNVNPIAVPGGTSLSSSCPSNDPTLTLSWASASCSSNYLVYRCLGTSCTPNVLVGSTSSTSFADDTVNAMTDYCYNVRGCNGGICSNSSVVRCGRVNIPTPTNLNAVGNYCAGVAAINLNWTDVTCQTSYTVHRCTGTTCTPTAQIGTTSGNTTTYTDSTVLASVYYNYRVRACVGTDCSGYSNPDYDNAQAPSCAVACTPVSPQNMYVGGPTQAFQAFPTGVIGGPVQRMDFVRSGPNPSAITLSPGSDTTSPYTTNATAASSGVVSVTCNAYLGSSPACASLACSSTTNTFNVCTPGCSVVLNSGNPVNVSAGSTAQVQATISGNICGLTGTVNFTSGNTSIATVSPPSDSAPPYLTGLTGVAVGTTTLTAAASLPGGISCTPATVPVNVFNPPFWQAENGQIRSGGNLQSRLPSTYFLINEDPSTPLIAPSLAGIANYSGSLNLNSRPVTNDYNWAVNSAYTGFNFSYTFFESRLPIPFTPNIADANLQAVEWGDGRGTSYGGYDWYFWDGASLGDLTISQAKNFASQKVVLFVKNANLNINAPINLDDGRGFFMVVVQGNVVVGASVGGAPEVNPTTPDLEGFIFAGGSFISQRVLSLDPDVQLHVRGSVAAGSVSLNRDLLSMNSTRAGEYFEFAPDLFFNMPIYLTTRSIRWKEVGP